MRRTLQNLTASLLVVGLTATTSFGQTITNGGFAGPEAYGSVAPSWTMTGGSPDLVTIPSGLATPLTYTAPGAAVSSEGGNFQLLYENPTETYTEKERQTVTGFTVGDTYTLTYEEANFGPCYGASCYTSTGQFIVNISGVGSFTSGNILAVDDPWYTACITFTATATSHNIEFEADYIGPGGAGSWMSLDNVIITPGVGGGGGDAGFSYPTDTLCTSAGLTLPTISGAGGGDWTVSPAGLTLDAVTGEITPGSSTPGTYDITYTVVGCASDDSTWTMEIVDPPSADFEYDPAVWCANDVDPLPDFDTDGDLIDDGEAGTFTSTAGLVIDAATGEIDLDASTPGTYTVTNTVNSPGCTPVVFAFDVTINELPTATMGADETICGGGAFADIIFTITAGTGPWTVDYTFDGTPMTETPIPASPHSLPAVEGTYIFTSITDGNGCTNTLASTVIKDVNSLEAADFEYNGPYCANDPDAVADFDVDEDMVPDGISGAFTAMPAGLVIDAATGEVDLDASTPGTYTVTNTVVSPGCGTVTYDATITINEIPDATITGDEQICDGLAFGDVQFDITAGTGPWSIDYTLDGTPFTEGGIAATPATIPGSEGTYTLTSITDANGCTNTIAGSISKVTLPNPVVTPVADLQLCDGDNISATLGADIAGSVLSWTNTTGPDIGFGMAGVGNIGPATVSNTTGSAITVTVEIIATSPDGCVSLPQTFNVTVNPTPDVSFFNDPMNGCAPVLVTFNNTTTPMGSSCEWDFGDGTTGSGCSVVSHEYMAGTYDVSLTVTTAEGCSATTTYNDYISVEEAPTAAFSANPYVTDVQNTEIEFTNTSINAESYIWDFADGSANSSEINPTHTYPDVPNNYTVTLYAFANGGSCMDSARQVIIVQDVIVFYVPNTFSPDGDEYNEKFVPVFTSGYDPYDFHMTIFNRWGEVVFETYNAAYGWDGTYGNRGIVQDGTFVWQIEFKESMSDKRHKHRGHVTILK